MNTVSKAIGINIFTCPHFKQGSAAQLKQEQEEKQLLEAFKRILADKGLSDFIGAHQRPKGRGQDADGLWLYQKDNVWVVCEVSRNKLLMPAFFTHLKEAINYTLIIAGHKPIDV